MPATTPTSAATLAELAHVSLIYERAGAEPVRALSNVSLQVKAGKRLCILGANGSGKSTLASVLCGLLAPDTGTVQLVGENVCVDGAVNLSAYQRARRRLGLVFQNPDDQMVTSVVADDVAFGPENLGIERDEIRARVAREISRVALDAYAQADPRRLSGGQQQRVAIAAALAMEPQVVIFDEPGALLDVRGRSAILRVMGRLCKLGVGIVHITHYMEEALGADDVVVLDHGRVALAGTPEDVFAHGEELAALGLEQPFASRLASRLAARGLNVAWTCDDATLVQELAFLGKARLSHADTLAMHSNARGRYSNRDMSEYSPAKAQVSELDTLENRENTTAHGILNAPGKVSLAALEGSRAVSVASESESAAAPCVLGGAASPSGDNPVMIAEASETTEAPALEAHGASFSYQGDGEKFALQDVSLQIPAGKSVAIVGQTGSGKSTLLRLLCALDVPDAGEVLISGASTRVEGRGRRARAARAQLRTQVGFVMQRPERQLFANTVEDDVAFGPSNQGLSPTEVEERVNWALEVCGLTDRRKASPFELSGGKQRLCAIAGILAMRPTTLVLDEPTAGLDPKSRSELRAILADLHTHGVTIVQVTHSMEDAACAEEVIVLDQSRLLATGAPAEVFSRVNGELLATHGLGLPLPLAWALRLEEAGVAEPEALGNPLTIDELVEALEKCNTGAWHRVSSSCEEVEHGA